MIRTLEGDCCRIKRFATLKDLYQMRGVKADDELRHTVKDKLMVLIEWPDDLQMCYHIGNLSEDYPGEIAKAIKELHQ